MINRRQFLEWLGASSAGLAISGASTAYAQPVSPKARVIVVGGGMAGAAAAKFLRMWGDQLDITLVERDLQYTSCILSNLVVTGQRSIGQLQFSYAALRGKYAIRVVQGDVAALDPVKKTLRLTDGTALAADRIVLAPGVEFDVIAGLESAAAQERVPHAWKAGAQTLALRAQARLQDAQ